MTTPIALFLAHAVALEQEAADRYAELADAMEVHHNPKVADLFRKLSEFSKLHLAEVSEIAKGHDLPRLKPWDYQWKDGDSPEAAPLDGSHYMMTAYHCLKLAMVNEKRGQEFYAAQAAESPDPEVKKYAKMFADEESEHVVMLEQWITHVPEPDSNWDMDMDPPVVSD